MLELLKSMIDWNAQPSLEAEAGASIIASGEPTALIFCLETGTQQTVKAEPMAMAI
ncbi:MAG: hypothetical protein CM15mP115_12120 [Alphaproteobacteria bacterium]|nr:MAG: hypothetical protein CM15mP115_12120 [Alphaproteobacteria bacterium]